ncbi:peroxiredoxin [Rhodobacter ferrooxidans]|uniref:thioredoxin-dependent peroxiredoxin n=1 Tax=Rhodobacter ferrooxidans TaxID=371731 RepID=C8RZI1_9RHOB|nr:peroxiredoxin [Rhodobacter sp. SW2]EEW25778.1 alkyl hydroperoxide reductase/ Thiol specific antioxidant/ Mal allergen [Rhodobacter sp. SW2]
MTALSANDTAPDFTLPRNGGGQLTLSALRPQPVVLYFYPRNDTPGCTTEAVEFTARTADFLLAGATIVGVSKDTVASHDKFVKKHALGIALVSDEAGQTCEDYGTWVEKSMYGKTSMGIERSTFLIGGDGKIVQVWRKVSVKGHVDEVLAAVKAMTA